ncbi:hypothetical protein L6452_22923 [Arctium lappa]|uniref:Uncharacterized protein n=1 Tax=Arctium lappa TaxID=4217 RepID=A0ACB9B1G7_ARCLA|nr:hypothetical protein L6452_22923 [Arctium lappa]
MFYQDGENLATGSREFTAFLHFSYAQNAPQDYVNAHNKARKEVGVGPVKWDDKLAKLAEYEVNQRKINCSLLEGSRFYMEGENLAKGELTGTDAVDLWISWKSVYHYKSNTCSHHVCFRYITVVWSKTTHIGCARAKCDKSKNWYVVCRYVPPAKSRERPY